MFFNITTPKFAAQAIKKAAEIDWKPAHYLVNVAASIGATLKPAGLENSQGILTAIYVKDPTDTKWAKAPDFIAWKDWMEKYNPTANLADGSNVTGYSFAWTLVQVLKACGDDLTRENVMKQAASMKGLEAPMLLPGITLNTSATNFFPIQAVQMAKLSGDHWELFGELIHGDA